MTSEPAGDGRRLFKWADLPVLAILVALIRTMKRTTRDGHSSCLPASVALNRAMRCSKLKISMVLAGCAVWLAVLGWIDRATGYELGLFAF
jgi:hypothetical protein